ncbi:hypothetical protein AGMMS49525_03460 [Bacteroidia bacterium]|nr:hypothetical protein AGMMS49525_03460 [Bacteroidia bacterium]
MTAAIALCMAMTTLTVWASGTINLNTGAGDGSGYTFAGDSLRITANGTYTIQGDGTPTANRIIVAPGVIATITLQNVNIALPGDFEILNTAFDMAGATVLLNLVGDNIIEASRDYHGIINVPNRSTLVIDGTGSLTVNNINYGYSAAIGGDWLGVAGDITINGGTVTADGIPGGGIGPGTFGRGGTFAMNGDAFVMTSSVGDEGKNNKTGGLLFLGDRHYGMMYGSNSTLTHDRTIPAGKWLLIDEDQALTVDPGITLTNEGFIVKLGALNGNVINSGGGKIYDGIKINNIIYVNVDDIYALVFGYAGAPSSADILDYVTISGQTLAVTEIMPEAFRLGRSLTSVTVPASVTNIGDFAFARCNPGLKTIVFASPTPPVIGDSVLSYSWTDPNLSVYVPAGSLAAYQSASTDVQWQDLYSKGQLKEYGVVVQRTRDELGWTNDGKVIALYQSGFLKYSGTHVGNGISLFLRNDIPDGNYDVYDGGIKTDVSVTVTNNTGAAVLNYCTINFNVTNENASGSSISATYDGLPIFNDDLVLPNKTLVVSVVAAGSLTYAYSWSGYPTETGSTLTVSSLQRKFNTLCTVTGLSLAGVVTIDEEPIVGDVLTANVSGLQTVPAGNAAGALSYQWNNSVEAIPGANSATYVVQTTDVNKNISVTVTAANCTGSVTSPETLPAGKGAPNYGSPPSGLTAFYGQTLADITLPPGAVPGTFAWEVDSAANMLVGPIGTNDFTVKFVPANLDIWAEVTGLQVTVDVSESVGMPTPPAIVFPQTTVATYDPTQTLADIIATGGSGDGRFVWTYPNIVPDVPTTTYSITFIPNDAVNYNYIGTTSFTEMVSLAVNPATPTYTVPTNLTSRYGQTLANIALPDGFDWEDPLTTPVGAAGPHTFTVKFTPSDVVNYLVVTGIPVTVSVSIQGAPAAPTVKFPTVNTITYDPAQTLASVSWNADGTGDGTFAWTTPTIVPDVPTTGYSMTFTPNDVLNYDYTGVVFTQDVPVTVNKATPTDPTHYTTPSGLTATYGQTLRDVNLPAGFNWENALTTSVGTLGVHNFMAAFTPSDLVNYKVATGIVVDITVSAVIGQPAHPAVTFPTANGITYDPTKTLATVPLNLDGDWTEGTFAWTNPITVPDVTTGSYMVTFTPYDPINWDYSGIALTRLVALPVSKANPVYTLPADLTATYGQTLADVTLPPGFTWDDDLTTLVVVGNRDYPITFTPSDVINYNIIRGLAVPIRVNNTGATPAPAVIFPSANAITYRPGQTLASVPFNSDGSGDGTFAWTNPTAVPVVATSSYSVTFTPRDAVNFDYTGIVIRKNIDLQVNKAMPAYTAPASLTATAGQTLANVTLPAGFSWEDPLTTSVGPAGSVNSFTVTFTPGDVNNYIVVTGIPVTITVSVVGASPAPPITFPTATGVVYSSTQTLASIPLNGGAGDGTFAWTTPTTVPNVTTGSYWVTFTPNDAVNFDYTGITLTQLVPLAVTPATPNFIVPTNLTAKYGQTLGNVTLPAGFSWEDPTTTLLLTAGVNSFMLRFTPSDLVNYKVATGIVVDITVSAVIGQPAHPAVTFPTANGITYDPTKTLATVPLNLDGDWTEGTFAWTNPITVPDVTTGSYMVTFTPYDPINWDYSGIALTRLVALPVSKANPVYTLPVDLTATYGQTLADVTLPPGFTWDDDLTTLVVVGNRDYPITFTPSDVINYNIIRGLAVPIRVNNTGATPAPAVIFPSANAITYRPGQTLASVPFNSDGSGDGTFAWTNPTAVPVVATSSYSVTFTPRDAVNFDYTGIVIRKNIDLQVNKAMPAYTAPASLTATAGQTLANVTLPAGFSWEDPLTTSVGPAGSVNSFTVTFTPGDVNNYIVVTGIPVTITVSVVGASPAPPITFPTATGVVYSSTQTLASIPLNGGAGDGTFAWTTPTTVPNVTTGSYWVTFTPNDAVNFDYTGITLTQLVPLAVTPATPNFIVPTNLTAKYGQTLGNVTLPAGFSWEDPTTTLLLTAGVNSFMLRFTPSDAVNYVVVPNIPANVTVSTQGASAAPAVTFPTANSVTYSPSQTLATVPLNSDGSGDGTFAWTDLSTVPQVAIGGYSVTFMPNDAVNLDYTGITLTKNVALAVIPAAPTYTAPTGLTATYGQTLSNVALPSGFTWELTPAITLVGAIGSNTFTVRFTPSDPNYGVATGIPVSIAVSAATGKPAPPAITFPTANSVTYNPSQTLAAVPLNSDGSGDGTFVWTTLTTVPNVTINSYSVSFIPNDPVNFDYTGVALTQQVSLIVNKANPNLVFPTAPALGITYSPTQTLASVPLSGGSGNGTFAWTNPNVVPSAATSSYSVTFTPNDVINYDYTGIELSQSIALTVKKGTPEYPTVISLTAKAGQTLADVVLPAGFSWEDPLTTSVGPGGSANPFTVTFTPSDEINYNQVAGISVDISVSSAGAPAAPAVTFPTANDVTYSPTQTLTSIPLIGGSGDGTFSWANPSSVPTVPIGSYLVTFIPNDALNFDYSGIALMELVSLTVNKATPPYTVPTGLTAIYGQTLANVVLSAGFSWEVATTTLLDALGTANFTVKYTPGDLDNYIEVTGIPVSVAVNAATGKPAPPTVTFPTTVGVIYNPSQTLADITLNGGSGDGTFSWANPSSVPTVPIGSYLVTFIPNDALNFDYSGIALMELVSLTVNKATPPYTVPTGLTAIYGQTLANVVLSAGFSWEVATTTLLDALGTANFTVKYTPGDLDNYIEVTGIPVSVAVNAATGKPAPPTVTFPTTVGVIYNPSQTLADITLNGGSGDGTFVWTTPSTVPDVATGSYSVSFIPNDATAYDYSSIALKQDVALTVSPATPTYTVPTGLTAVVGQTLADVTLPTGFSWEDPATTSVGAIGTNNFTVKFTPSDANYSVVTGISVGITVSTSSGKPIAPAVTFPTANSVVYSATQTLASVPFNSDGAGDGTFVWTNSDSIPVVAVSNYLVTFIPNDAMNFDYSGVVFTRPVSLIVTKGVPPYTVPTGLIAATGRTLGDVTLPSGFSWEDPTTTSVGAIGVNNFTVKYTPNDLANYNEVTGISVSITVSVKPLAPAVVYPTANGVVYDATQTLATIPLIGGSGDGTFAWTNPSTVPDVVTGSYYVTFTPNNAVDFDYAGIPLQQLVTLAVSKATPPYTAPTGLTAFYAQTLADVVLPAGFRWEVASTTLLDALGTANFTVKYTPSDLDNYNEVTGISVSVTVNEATGKPTPPTVTFPTTSSVIYSPTQTLATIPLLGGSSNGSFRWTNSGTVPDVATGSYLVTFIPNDAANYNYVGVTLHRLVALVVTKAPGGTPPTAPAGITAVVGQTLASVVLPVGFSWVDASIALTKGGLQKFRAEYTSSDGNYDDGIIEITVDVQIVFDTYVEAKWDNLFLLKADQLKQEGYNFTLCRWYEDNVLLDAPDPGNYVSKGPSRSDVFTAGSKHRFELVMEDRTVVSSTDVAYVLRASEQVLNVYPTPVQRGQRMTIEGIPDSVEDIRIYDMNGRPISTHRVTSQHATSVQAPATTGVYYVKVGELTKKIIVE